MGKCKFNDYTLPEPPAGWNRETHPHAMILCVTGTVTFHFVCHSLPLSVKDVDGAACIGFDPGASVVDYRYSRTDDAYEWVSVANDYAPTEGEEWTYYKPDTAEWIWCNTDICDESGAVVYAASEPVPIAEKQFSLRSFLTGLALGLSGKPLPLMREPVAYLYNGVGPLPLFPDDWDDETYPNICLVRIPDTSDNYYLYASALPFENATEASNDGYILAPHPTYKWKKTNAAEEWTSKGLDGGEGCTITRSWIIWTNCNIPNTDGSVYLAASEPVPVYGGES